MKIKILIVAILFCLSGKAWSNSIDTLSRTEANHLHHENHKNEIGIANSPVFFTNTKKISYGLHIHYIRNIKESGFGIGAGYERIFDKQGHNMLGVVVSYMPVDKLSFMVSPGIAFEQNHSHSPDFAVHLETSYEFEINNFHLGPNFEFAYDSEDYHFSLGLHFGIGF